LCSRTSVMSSGSELGTVMMSALEDYLLSEEESEDLANLMEHVLKGRLLIQAENASAAQRRRREAFKEEVEFI